MGIVWFLAGPFVGAVTRTCTLPQGTALFFPIVNAAFGAAVGDCEPTAPGVPCIPSVLRAAAEVSMDSVTLEASIGSRWHVAHGSEPPRLEHSGSPTQFP